MSNPLPAWVRRVLVGAVLVVAGAAALAAIARPALRQGQLIDVAAQTCRERHVEATAWLEREPELAAALEREQRDASERGVHLLQADDEVVVHATLRQLAEASGLEVLEFRLGTPRHGEAFDTVGATLQISGDRAELPPFLEAFYRQPRVVRLVSLDLESPEFGTQRAVATLRWEFASPARTRSPTPDPSRIWAPPALVNPESADAVAGWNMRAWDALVEDARALQSLAPELRRVAGIEAERGALQKERLALERWKEGSESERGAVLRKAPQLLHRLDASAVGRAGLRPGPGGTLQIVDDD